MEGEWQGMYDVMIIGSGPAGISAALTAKNRNLEFCWFGSKGLSAKIEKAGQVGNYPGLIQVTGLEMRDIFQQQVEEAGISLVTEQISSIYPMGNSYAVNVKGKMYEAKSLLLAIGMETTKTILGEERLLGRGVSYCATCDGFLYKEKRIAVVCTNPQFEEEIAFLADLADEVTVFTTYRGFSLERGNIHASIGYPSEIKGEKQVEALVFQGKEIPVDGVFCLKDSVSPSVLLKGLEMKDGHIRVDRAQQTNLKGCFAAGDCTGRPYQYAKAVGEGNVALHSILDYLKEQ